jgi:fructosamine-3-kinase
MARMAGTAARAEALLGLGVVSTTPVAGGDICTSTRLRLTDGHGAIIKTRPHAPEGFFEREAEGLRWLAEAKGARIPRVLAVADDCLVLDWIEPGKPTTDVAERFGRDLAAMHQAGADSFGAETDGFIGLAPLPNRPLPSWPEFFASRRVMPYVRAAVDRQALTAEEAAAIEAAMRRIHDFAGDPEDPARIHGDLWSGNLVWGADGDIWLIDPAAHGGHRETDLAMLALFGAPHLQRILDSYSEAWPLAEGWRERLPLHQLHPLLVHAVLFGGTYGARAASAAQALLDGKGSAG